MQQLNPGETFTINRILKDHTDSSTYFVQAKVYDSVTRQLLATKNLTDNGNRWFSTTYKVPFDNVFSTGKPILIVTSVYVDSGYATKSPNHLEEPEEYLIQQRWNAGIAFGSGGGGYDETQLLIKLGKMMDAKLEAMKPLPVKLPKELDVKALLVELSTQVDAIVKGHVGGIKPAKATDVQPLIDRLDALAATVAGRPKFEKTDLASVMTSIQNMKGFLESMQKDIEGVLQKVILPLVEENRRLKVVTGSDGAKIQLDTSSPQEKQREMVLKRLAMKHGIR